MLSNVQNVVVSDVSTQFFPTDAQELMEEVIEPVHKLWLSMNKKLVMKTAIIEKLNGTIKYERGQYSVGLPWKSVNPLLSHNF